MSAGYAWTAWLFWIGGAMVALASLSLLIWALFWDRARGRRRCPRCWYDMSGTPGNLTCSECGRTVKRESMLFRTRRRWRWVVVAMLLMIGSIPLGLTPKAKRDGIVAVLPSTFLIALMPSAEDSRNFSRVFRTGPPPQQSWWLEFKEGVFRELQQRAQSDTLAAWQYRWLLRRQWDDENPPWEFEIRTRDAWRNSEIAYALPVVQRNLSWYIGLNTLRFRIVDRRSGEEVASFETESFASFIQPTDPWREVAIPSDPHAATFDVEIIVDRGSSNAADPQWQRIWSAQQQLAIRRAEAPIDRSKPESKDELDAEIMSRLRIAVDREAIGLRWSRVKPDATPLPTLALRFELLRNDARVTEARAWWTSEWNGESSLMGPTAVPLYYRVRWPQPLSAEMLSPGSDEWILRITGDAELALRDVGSKSHWAGEILVPLRLDAQTQTLGK